MTEHLPSPNGNAIAAETVDVADVARTVRRRWRAVITCVVLGLVVAGGGVLFAPRRLDGKASVFARPGGGGGGSISGAVSGVGELLGNLGSLGLGGSLETE